jgi:acyl carrier protein
MPELEPVTFTTFQQHLARITHLQPDKLTPDTNLVVDLGLDSLKLLQIILGFDRLGVRASLANAWQIQTVGDAYEYYLRAIRDNPAAHGNRP